MAWSLSLEVRVPESRPPYRSGGKLEEHFQSQVVSRTKHRISATWADRIQVLHIQICWLLTSVDKPKREERHYEVHREREAWQKMRVEIKRKQLESAKRKRPTSKKRDDTDNRQPLSLLYFQFPQCTIHLAWFCYQSSSE